MLAEQSERHPVGAIVGAAAAARQECRRIGSGIGLMTGRMPMLPPDSRPSGATGQGLEVVRETLRRRTVACAPGEKGTSLKYWVVVTDP
jgi:hypothetical protein